MKLLFSLRLKSYFFNSQDFSRCHSVDFIDLHFKSEVVPASPGDQQIPVGGVLLTGLQIIGAQWDQQRGCLDDLSPRSQTVNK